MRAKLLFPIILIIIGWFTVNRCNEQTEEELKAKKKAIFYPPAQSPFKNNVGINFSVEETDWFIDPSIRYNQALQRQYTYERLVNISKDFKLIRIYSFLIAGWEQTGTMSAEGYALSTLAKQDSKVEAVIGTSDRIDWFLDSNNVQQYVDSIKSKFGSAVSQVKTILIGNEINANGFNSGQITIILSNFNKALTKDGLNIPVTVSFSNLPVQAGDTLSDNLVNSIVSGWNSNWNSNKPFVFIDPYPDAEGINNAAGVYKWQYKVTKYYKTLHPSLQIFIGETGGEGCDSDYKTVVVINSVFSQLSIQYDSVKKTVPTFLFEAINEPQKPSSPEQQYMGVYFDSSKPSKTDVRLKAGVMLPSWFKKK